MFNLPINRRLVHLLGSFKIKVHYCRYIYIYILMLGFKISKFNCFEMLFIYFFPYKKIFESVAIDLLHLHDIFLLLWQNNVNHTIPPDDERMSSLLFTAHTLTRWPLSAVSVYLSANKTEVTWTCGGDGDRSRAAVPSWETIFRADSHFWQWIEASSTSAQIVTATYTKLEKLQQPLVMLHSSSAVLAALCNEW